MRPFVEPPRARPVSQSFVAFTHSAPAFPFAWHCHPEAELTLIESGTGTRYIGDSITPYVAGDLALLGSNLPHTWCSDSAADDPSLHRVTVVHFPCDLFASANPELRKIQSLLRKARRGCTFSHAVARRVALRLKMLPRKRGFSAWSELVGILNLLANDPRITPIASVGYAPEITQGQKFRLERALSYIATHATEEDLNLRDVATAVHLTPNAFSRFFRHMNGENFIKHLTQVRVGSACRQLSESDRGVAEIAYACGFGNLSNFNRRFRALKHMTPTAYRRRFRSTP